MKEAGGKRWVGLEHVHKRPALREAPRSSIGGDSESGRRSRSGGGSPRGSNDNCSPISAFLASWARLRLSSTINERASAFTSSSPPLDSRLLLIMSGTRCWINFAAGDSQAYEKALRRYQELVKWLAENGAKYGLAGKLEELDDAGRETLTAVYEGDTKVRDISAEYCASRLTCERTDLAQAVRPLPSTVSSPSSTIFHRLFCVRPEENDRQLPRSPDGREEARLEATAESAFAVQGQQGVQD